MSHIQYRHLRTIKLMGELYTCDHIAEDFIHKGLPSIAVQRSFIFLQDWEVMLL